MKLQSLFAALSFIVPAFASNPQITNKVFFEISQGEKVLGRVLFGLYGNTRSPFVNEEAVLFRLQPKTLEHLLLERKVMVTRDLNSIVSSSSS